MFAVALAGGCKCGRTPASVAPVDSSAAIASAGSAGGSPSSASNTQSLVREEVVPKELWIRVYTHTFDTPKGPVPCWIYESEGLWALRQKEILLSVKRNPDEADSMYDRSLFQLYVEIHALARQGKLVDINGYSRLAPDGPPLLGRDDFDCMMYMRPQPIPGIEMRAPALSAIIVTCRELDMADKLGYTRLQSRLGFATRYYPAPPWTDRKRAEVVYPGEIKQSLLANATHAHATGVSVSLERAGGVAAVTGKGHFFVPGDRIVLRVLPRGAKVMKEIAKDADNGVLLLVESDPGADTCLVWHPQQASPVAISQPGAAGERLCGNFLLLAPTESQGASTFEDGFTMGFTSAVWKRVREAIMAGKPISIPGSDTVPAFAVEWIPAFYINPIDGSRYETEDGWNRYTPTASGASASGGSSTASIVLLTSEEQLAQRTTVGDLSDLLTTITVTVETEIAAVQDGPGSDFVIECEVRPGKEKTFRMAQRPSADRMLAAAIHKKLAAIDAPGVKGPIKFHVELKIRGGSGGGDWIPLPNP